METRASIMQCWATKFKPLNVAVPENAPVVNAPVVGVVDYSKIARVGCGGGPVLVAEA